MQKSIYTKEQRALVKTLRYIRKNAELSQSQLASKLGKPQSFVSKYESGERRLDFLEIRSICLSADISLADFIKHFERFLKEKHEAWSEILQMR